MEGITVLNEEILIYSGPIVFLLVIILAGVVVACGIYCGIACCDEDHKTAFKFFMVMVVSGILTCAITTSPIFNWKYTKYEVILDDTVSYKQIEEKFDIGETRGDITILYEKDYDKPPNKR